MGPEKVKMCVRYTLLIANSLLALLGLLLLAGGVWRIVDNESLREVANEIKDTQEWNDVRRGWTGWRMLSRRRPATSTSTMPSSPWAESPSSSHSLGFVEPKRRTSASSPSTASASSSTLTTPTSTSLRSPSARRLRRLTLTLRGWIPGPSLSRTCSLEYPPASPPSSSSSPSLSAAGRGGRRGSKDMLTPFRLKKTLLHISTVFQ